MEVSAPRSDLEERTLRFARDMRAFVKQLPRTTASIEDGAQLIRSSGSIGANYIEAQEAMSRKDFAMRVKISRKEAKESKYWLNLLEVPPALLHEHRRLLQEVGELLKIFSSIVQKVKQKRKTHSICAAGSKSVFLERAIYGPFLSRKVRTSSSSRASRLPKIAEAIWSALSGCSSSM